MYWNNWDEFHFRWLNIKEFDATILIPIMLHSWTILNYLSCNWSEFSSLPISNQKIIHLTSFFCPSMISIYRYLSTNRQNEPPKTDVNMFISEFSKDLKDFFEIWIDLKRFLDFQGHFRRQKMSKIGIGWWRHNRLKG